MGLIRLVRARFLEKNSRQKQPWKLEARGRPGVRQESQGASPGANQEDQGAGVPQG